MDYQKLTKVEEEVMHMIWKEVEPCTVSHLIEKMDEPKPPHSTISSIVRILEGKGFLDHKAYGRTHVYFPLVEESVYMKWSISNLISKYFKGSRTELVSFLVREDDLTIKDLGEIINRLESE